jgi:hypothetical protein
VEHQELLTAKQTDHLTREQIAPRFFEIARVRVRFDHVSSFTVNSDHREM